MYDDLLSRDSDKFSITVSTVSTILRIKSSHRERRVEVVFITLGVTVNILKVKMLSNPRMEKGIVTINKLHGFCILTKNM